MVGNAVDIDVWLRQAAAAGHLAAVRLLLEAGANPNGFDDVEGKRGGIPGYHGRQPQRKAVCYGNTATIPMTRAHGIPTPKRRGRNPWP